jgi:hypothetical protein
MENQRHFPQLFASGGGLSRGKVYPWLASIGLVLFTIHDFLLQGLFTGIGMILICAGMWPLCCSRKVISFGSKWVWIPMLVIVSSAWMRGVFYGDWPGAVFLSVMFCLYLYSRNYDLLKAFFPATIIGAISVIAVGVMYPGMCSAGILAALPMVGHQTNYNIATGFLVFGLLVYKGRYKWELGTLVLIALFFTGAAEALLLIGILAVVMVLRRDTDYRKLAITLSILWVVVTVWTVLGYTQSLWMRPINIVGLKEYETQRALVARILGYESALAELKPLGNGFALFEVSARTVHNVPLIIVDQLGIAAGIAWVVATVYCLIHSKRKYLWIGFIAMGLVDHFTWGNAAIWWWVIAGQV